MAIWVIMEASISINIAHWHKELPWSMCFYYYMWVLHILIESFMDIELIFFWMKGKFFLKKKLDGHKIARCLFTICKLLLVYGSW
jgi:hypothetical protein